MTDIKNLQKLVGRLVFEQDNLTETLKTPEENTMRAVEILQKAIDELRWLQAEIVVDFMQQKKKA